jgi:hypothetical protein
MTTIRKHSSARVLMFASAFLLTVALSITPGHAKTDFGVRGGAYSDADRPFLGAEAVFGVGTGQRWFGNPNLEHAFAETGGTDLTALSFDFHYDFPGGQPYTVWAGAGPTLIFRDRNIPGRSDETDTGVNLVLGIGGKTGDVRPYGQMKVVVASDSEAVLGVGVRF